MLEFPELQSWYNVFTPFLQKGTGLIAKRDIAKLNWGRSQTAFDYVPNC